MVRTSDFGVLALACLALATSACGGLSDVVSDTGYQGTWQRGNERVQSTVSIVEVDGKHLFRWEKTSEDGRVKVRCGWQGPCEEFVDGEKVSDFTIRPWIDEETQRLRVECNGTTHSPEVVIHYVDELVVMNNGLTLRSHTIEDTHGTYDFVMFFFV